MTTAGEVEQILRNILEEPRDDGLRLIYADALADAGREGEAEFVRVSMRLAKGWAEKAEKAEKCSWGGTCGCDWHEARRDIGGVTPPGVQHVIDVPDPEAWLASGLYWWRGLAEVWAVPDVVAFHNVASDVFTRHPIRRVVLRCEVGRHIPATSVPIGVLEILSSDRDPASRIRHGVTYESANLARADLESCLARHGRRLAGLPPLL